MAMPDHLPYSATVGVVKDYLSAAGEEYVSGQQNIISVPFDRIVKVTDFEGRTIEDEAYLSNLEATASWLGGAPSVKERKIRVNNQLMHDVVEIMDTRQAIEVARMALGATVMVPEMADGMQKMQKGAKPALGKWAVYGLQADDTYYELSRVSGVEGGIGLKEFLAVTFDGAFGVLHEAHKAQLEKLLQRRMKQTLREQGHTPSSTPDFKEAGYYMQKTEIQKAAA